MLEGLYAYIPVDIVDSIIIPYFSVKELAENFIVSGQHTPNQRLWKRICERDYAHLSKVELILDKVKQFVKDRNDDAIIVLIMLGLISLDLFGEWFKGHLPNDLIFRLFVQTYPGSFTHLINLASDNFTRILFSSLYSGLAYILNRNNPIPINDILPKDPSDVIYKFVVDLSNPRDLTDLTRSSLETVIRICVGFYVERGYRPLDLPIKIEEDEYVSNNYTLFELLIEQIPRLAVFFVDTYPLYVGLNYLYVDRDGETYAHMAAQQGLSTLYAALMRKEPLLKTTRNNNGETPDTVWRRAQAKTSDPI